MPRRPRAALSDRAGRPGFLSSAERPVTHDFPSGQSILVVDDTHVVRRAAFRMLSEAGYRVFEAGSVAEALEVLGTAKQPVSLVLADVVMPDMSGVDLARLVHDQWPRVPVLFMSAYGAEVLVQEGAEQTNVEFLGKPFTRDELLEKVAATIRKYPKRNGEQSRSERA